jgi:hypothetical protein
VWNGQIDIAGAVGVVDAKYHFNDGQPITTTRPAGGEATEETEKVVHADGTEISWTAAVHGKYDGLRVKITSKTAEVSGTIKVGNFTVPFTVTEEPKK